MAVATVAAVDADAAAAAVDGTRIGRSSHRDKAAWAGALSLRRTIVDGTSLVDRSNQGEDTQYSNIHTFQ